MNQSSFAYRLMFNVIGISSFLSCLMILVIFVEALLLQDFHKFQAFFDKYQGIEPFVIVVLPIVLISGVAWPWRQYVIFKERRSAS